MALIMDCDTCYWCLDNHCFAPIDYDMGCYCSLFEQDIFGNWVLNFMVIYGSDCLL